LAGECVNDQGETRQYGESEKKIAKERQCGHRVEDGQQRGRGYQGDREINNEGTK
jgi:hypothetical protein